MSFTSRYRYLAIVSVVATLVAIIIATNVFSPSKDSTYEYVGGEYIE